MRDGHAASCSAILYNFVVRPRTWRCVPSNSCRHKGSCLELNARPLVPHNCSCRQQVFSKLLQAFAIWRGVKHKPVKPPACHYHRCIVALPIWRLHVAGSWLVLIACGRSAAFCLCPCELNGELARGRESDPSSWFVSRHVGMTGYFVRCTGECVNFIWDYQVLQGFLKRWVE